MPEIVETLLAEKGNNYDETGQAIASWNRSIIFLPKGAVPEQRVRVVLEEISGKTDRRGRPMYQSSPAPVEYTERWKDNGDRTFSRVKIAIDWQLSESEAETLETRPASTREVVYTTRTDRKVVWGQDLASSYVEQVEVKVFHAQREAVLNGELKWEKTTEREEQGAPTQLPIVKVAVGYGDWAAHKPEVTYQDNWSVTTDAFFGENSGDHARENTIWGNLPAWLQNQVLADYPVCSCGRSRRDSQVSDGFGKCELCRAEETCGRCGKKSTVKNLGGRLVCDNCQPYEEQEQLVSQFLPAEKRQELADFAKALLVVEPLPQEAGEMILGATLDHIASDYGRRNLIAEYAGYAWYYFADQGVYGSKFSPAAMQILRHLPQATGNQLVEMVAWLAGYQKVEDCERCGDFYHDTQVKGESRKPSLTEGDLAKLALAVKLRGSEADRQAVLEWLKNHKEDSNKRIADLAKTVSELLEKKEQDYDLAMAKIREFEAQQADRQARADAGEVWLDVFVSTSTRSRTHTDVWAIAADGSLLEPKPEIVGSGRHQDTVGYDFGDLPTNVLVISWSHDNYGYQRTECWEVHCLPKSLTPAQTEQFQALRQEHQQYFIGPGTGWDLAKVGQVSFSTEYSRDLQGEDRQAYDEMCASFPINVSQWETSPGEDGDGKEIPGRWIVYARRPTGPNAEAIRELRSQIRELESQVSHLESEWEQAKQGQAGRVLVTWQQETYRDKAQLVATTNFTGQLRVRKEDGGDEYEEYSGPVKWVCNQHAAEYTDSPPQPGQTWVATTGRKIGQTGKGIPVVIANPQVNISSLAGLREELEKAQRKLEALKSAPPSTVDKPFDENGEPLTVMAAALQKAGLATIK